MLLREGRPLADYPVEVMFLAAPPDMETNAIGEASFRMPPGGPMTVITDINGVFNVGTPFAGFWGFGAIGSGPDTEHEGKYLFQDAILWMEVHAPAFGE